MALVDSKYRFLFTDIGACGRRSDGGIFKDSKMGQAFEQKRMNLPEASPLREGGPAVPYVIVADEAFQLSDYLVRPFPGRSAGTLSMDERVYNYRLSRARRVVENVFGILVSKFEILTRPIRGSIEFAKAVVKAIVVLHNFIRGKDDDNEKYLTPGLVDRELSSGEVIPGSWRQNIPDENAFYPLPRASTSNPPLDGQAIREELCKYFNEDGAVKFQYNRC